MNRREGQRGRFGPAGDLEIGRGWCRVLDAGEERVGGEELEHLDGPLAVLLYLADRGLVVATETVPPETWKILP